MDDRTKLLTAIGVILTITLFGTAWKSGTSAPSYDAQQSTVIDAVDPAPTEEQEARRQRGLHCLSPLDGADPFFVRAVKEGLRDPGSFEHIDTMIGPVTAKGRHPIEMKYRARNGFGGYNVETAYGAIDQDSCRATVIESPQQAKDLLG